MNRFDMLLDKPAPPAEKLDPEPRDFTVDILKECMLEEAIQSIRERIRWRLEHNDQLDVTYLSCEIPRGGFSYPISANNSPIA